MHRRTRRWGRALTALVALSLLAAACGNSDDEESADTTAAPDTTEAADDGATETTEAADDGSTETTEATDGGDRDTFVPIEGVPGVTDEEIGFVAFGTNSNNPLGTCVLDCYVDGIEAYFAWRNDEGGIYGRQLVLVDSLDDELARNLERAQDIVASDDYFGAFSATQVASGWGLLNDNGIPLWTWSIHAEAYNRPFIWGYAPALCFDCTNRTVPWYIDKTGSKVAASLGYGISENSKRCADANAASVERYGADVGGATVGYVNNDLAFGLPNGIGPEVTAMKDAGVDIIFACVDLNAMKTLGQELQRQGMDDVTMIHSNTYNQDFVAEAGDIFEGDYVTVSFIPFESGSDNEMLVKFLEYMESTGSDVTELAMIGWINAHQAYEGLLLAGPDFDRQKVADARNAMTADSAGGLINPIDWTRQHTPPTEDDNTNDSVLKCLASVQIVDGAFTLASGTADAPFECWSSESYDWSEPVPTSFD